MADYMTSPLLQLPAEWRPEVLDFWCFWSHLLDNQLALATWLRRWTAEGLTLADAREMFERLTRPAAVRQIKFKGELAAELADLAEAVLAKRRPHVVRRAADNPQLNLPNAPPMVLPAREGA